MLKRDSLTAQMQQLSQVLAKVKRLIIEDNESQAKKVVLDSFLDYYALKESDVLNLSEDDFLHVLKKRTFVAEELTMLAYFVDEIAGLQDDFKDQIALYKKYIRIVDYLEEGFQFISFDHMARRNLLAQQINPL